MRAQNSPPRGPYFYVTIKVMPSKKPRIIFIIVGVFSLLLAAGVLCINYFGVPGYVGEGLLTVRSPYQDINEKIFSAIADLKSFQLAGELGSDGFSASVTSTVDLFDNKNIKLDLVSNLNFPTERKNYSAVVELRRIAPENFYFKISQAVLFSDVKVLLQDLLNKWIVANSNLIQEVNPEENYDLGFSEEIFLINLRQSLKSASPIILTRKLAEDHYEFSATPESLALFLGKLFGDLSGQPFTAEETSGLADSLYGYNFKGEIIINNATYLPKEIIINWQDTILVDLFVSNTNEPFSIVKIDGAVDLEELLK